MSPQLQKEVTTVFCCSKCANKLRVKANYKRKDDTWKCYACGHTMDSDNSKNNSVRKRPSDFFTKLTRKKVVKTIEMLDGRPVVEGTKIKYKESVALVQRKTKRKFKDEDVIDRKEILTLIKKYCASKNPYKLTMYDIRNPAFIAFLFLTGARVEEICGVREQEEYVQDNHTYKHWNGKYIVEPLKKYQISKTRYDKRDVITWDVENLPVLKRRGETVPDESDILGEKTKQIIPRRHVSIPLDLEKEFVYYVDKWLLRLKDDDVVFELSPQQCWRICHTFNRSYNHLWRHLRATDLMNTYGLQGLQLRHFFGWSTEAMARRYAHLSKHTLLDSMLMGYKNRGEKIDYEDDKKSEKIEKSDTEISTD